MSLCDDLWAREALPSLARRQRGEGGDERIMEVGTQFDVLVGSVAERYPSTLPAACAKAIRNRAIPKQSLCVLATARNEGPYILDWVAHHLALGVEDFFIYTNDNTDGSDRLLELLAGNGLIRLYRNHVAPGVGPQLKAYAHALQFVPEILDFEWVSMMDVDEYLMINEAHFGSFIDFLNWIAPLQADSIALSWTFQGPNGARRWHDGPLSERFSRRKPPDRHVKSVFRPQLFSQGHPHFPNDDARWPRRYVTADGSLFRAWPFNEQPSCERAWNAHFYYKSAEEFLTRRLKNRGDGAVLDHFDEGLISEALAHLYVTMFSHPELCQGGDSPRTLALAGEARAALLALPGVAEADEACKAAYRQDVEQLREVLSRSIRFRTPNTPEAALYDLAFG